jgi:hypothetical protein
MRCKQCGEGKPTIMIKRTYPYLDEHYSNIVKQASQEWILCKKCHKDYERLYERAVLIKYWKIGTIKWIPYDWEKIHEDIPTENIWLEEFDKRE